MNLFAEITRTNALYYAAHGINATELYGTAPNADEYEVHASMAAGVPAELAEFKPRKLKHGAHYPRTGFQKLGYIEEHLRQTGCTPRESKTVAQFGTRRALDADGRLIYTNRLMPGEQWLDEAA